MIADCAAGEGRGTQKTHEVRSGVRPYLVRTASVYTGTATPTQRQTPMPAPAAAAEGGTGSAVVSDDLPSGVGRFGR